MTFEKKQLSFYAEINYFSRHCWPLNSKVIKMLVHSDNWWYLFIFDKNLERWFQKTTEAQKKDFFLRNQHTFSPTSCSKSGGDGPLPKYDFCFLLLTTPWGANAAPGLVASPPRAAVAAVRAITHHSARVCAVTHCKRRVPRGMRIRRRRIISCIRRRSSVAAKSTHSVAHVHVRINHRGGVVITIINTAIIIVIIIGQSASSSARHDDELRWQFNLRRLLQRYPAAQNNLSNDLRYAWEESKALRSPRIIKSDLSSNEILKYVIYLRSNVQKCT